MASVQKWLKTHYKTPNNRIPIFTTTATTKGMGWAPAKKSISATPTNIKFNCTIGQHLYHRAANANGSVGFHRLNANNASNKLNLVPLRKTSIRKGIAKLDAGKQGVVFLASARRSVPQGSEFVIKVCPTDKNLTKSQQISKIEYKIQSALYKVVPENIPKPIAPIIDCKSFLSPSELMSKSAVVNKEKDYSSQTLMFSEYIPYGPLPYYLDKIAVSKRLRLNDSLMKSFIFQVLFALYKIRKVYPGFRHNDLHLDNILVKPGTPYPVAVINDFGFSTLGNANTQNPLVNKGNFAKNWGIGAKTTPDYDVHLFLNELRKWCDKNKDKAVDKFRNTLLFLNDKVPAGYREENNTYTMRMRLKYNINYPGFPSVKQILRSKYFTGRARLTPTPTPPKKLKLNLNRIAFSNENLKATGISPNTRKWLLTRPVRKNTPAPIIKKSPSVNLSGLAKPKPKPKPKAKSASPVKKPKAKPKRKVKSASPLKRRTKK
jgi:serine/threonine protein kinase